VPLVFVSVLVAGAAIVTLLVPLVVVGDKVLVSLLDANVELLVCVVENKKTKVGAGKETMVMLYEAPRVVRVWLTVCSTCGMGVLPRSMARLLA
jgi:hypothetical protein